MTREEMQALVKEVLREIVEAQSVELPPEGITGELHLIGSKSPLDSMAFVMLTAGIEQRLSEQMDLSITIVNEKAMSLRHSPFRTVDTLADYVLELMREAQGGTGGGAP